MRNSSREKHSFIQFYFDDWQAGTARMTRIVRSVYFDICLYNWDKRRPVTAGGQTLMFADLGQQGEMIVDALVEEGALVRDSHGSIHSPRAMREGERAFSAWEGKRRGGRLRQGVDEDSSSLGATKLQDSSSNGATDSDSEPDSEPEPDSEEDSSSSRTRHLGQAEVVEAWNEMAASAGLSQVKTMTSERQKKLRVRLDEHKAEAIIEAIKTIPDNPFLMGENERQWKANFDWLLRPESCAKLTEGGYDRGRGKASAWVS